MSRSRIEELDRLFGELHARRCDLAGSSDNGQLYSSKDSDSTLWPTSAATLLIRSAAVVEQTINGITVRLWDDPFEWTLPERLSTSADLITYFAEVEAARVRGVQFVKDDSDLDKSIPAPVELRTLDQILRDALQRSETYFSSANTVLNRD